MPEGPEVRTLVDQLQNHLVSSVIETEISQSFSEALHRKANWTNYFLFPTGVFRVLEIKCKGKLLYWKLESENEEFYFLNHLAMTGGLSREKVDGWMWRVTNEKGSFYYYDHRKFGKFLPAKDFSAVQKELDKLGPDILSNPPSENEFLARFKNKRRNICALLMDQAVICGVGNYIKNEALYAAKIYPFAKARDLPDNVLLALRNHLLAIVQQSYQLQGATLSTFRNLDDKPGEFQQLLRVYKKQFDPSGKKVEILDPTPDQRTTYYVPEIQLHGKV